LQRGRTRRERPQKRSLPIKIWRIRISGGRERKNSMNSAALEEEAESVPKQSYRNEQGDTQWDGA